MEGGDTVEDGVARGIDDFDVFDGFGCTLVSTVLEFPLPFRPVGVLIHIVRHWYK